MSRFTSRLRFSLEELEDSLNAAPNADDDQIVDVAAIDDADADDDVEVVDGDDVEVVDEPTADQAAADQAAADEAAADEAAADEAAEGDTVEENIERTDEAVADVDETVEQAEELEEAAEGLESIREQMVAAQQRGGLSLQAARMANIAVESYTARLGIDADLMPSMESFGGNSSRLRATNLSIESLGDTIRKIIAGAIAIVKRIFAKIMELIKSIFRTSNALKRRLTALNEGVKKKAANGKPANNAIDASGVAKRIAVGTKVNLDAVSGMKSLIDLTGEFSSWQVDNMTIYNHNAQVVKDFLSGKIKSANFAKRFEKLKGARSKGENFVGAPLPGNYVVKGTVLKNNTFGIDTYAIDIVRTADYDKVSDKAKVPTLSIDQIKSVIKSGDDVVKFIGTFDKSAKDIAKAAKDWEKFKYEGKMSADDEKNAARAIGLIRADYLSISSYTSKVAAYVTRTMFAYVILAERSLKQYPSK